MKDFYTEYWKDPSHAPPVGDPDRPLRVDVVHSRMEADGAHRLLDVGCGRGDFAAALSAHDLKVVGMELDSTAISAGRDLFPGLELVNHSIDEAPWPWPDGSFDAVSCIEVIEHLLDPTTLLVEAKRVLRSGGMLFLSTPFHGRVKNLLLSLSLDRFQRHFANLESGHIRFFTDRHLAALLEANGFSPAEFVHYGRLWPIWRGVLVLARRGTP